MTTSPAADDLGGRSVSVALPIPADALVLLVGVAASGKSTFAQRHFATTEILSSDAMRAMIADDPGAQGATDDAFDLLHRILAMRLRRGRLTVIDATNVEDWARSELLAHGAAPSSAGRRDRAGPATRSCHRAERRACGSSTSAGRTAAAAPLAQGFAPLADR